MGANSTELISEQAQLVLQKYWGYDDFRPGQMEIVAGIIGNQSVLALMSTGGGKSVCFQVAGMLLEGLCVVVSPLISLIQDQVKRLLSQGISAAAFTSHLSANERAQVLEGLWQRKYKFLYLSPESLQNKELEKIFHLIEIPLLVVDEAHCVSMWGHDFRPKFLEISRFKEKHKIPKIAAFTATATRKVIADVIDNLGMKGPLVINKGFARGNLAIQVKNSLTSKMIVELAESKAKISPVIIYAPTRRKVEEVAENLLLSGVKAAYYHGGIDSTARKILLQRFIDNEIDVMVATNAFGMGVDKGNVYTVIHTAIPDSIENYFQEIGRAGRDGNQSIAITNLDWRGITLRQSMIENSFPGSKEINSVYNFLVKRVDALGDLRITEKEFLMEMSSLNRPKLYRILQMFLDAAVIHGFEKSKNDEISIRSLKSNILILSRWIDFRKNTQLKLNAIDKLTRLITVLTDSQCRMKAIMEYFSDYSVRECGKCDICTKIYK